MSSSTLIAVEQYLASEFSPDREYVDGEVQERNSAEKDHSKVQKALLLLLSAREKDLNIFAIQEQRLRVSPTRFRVPDVCVVAGPEPEEQVFTSPPLLCVEILSPEDRAGRMQEKIADYLTFGVPYVWVINPQTRRGYVYTATGMQEPADGILRTSKPTVEIRISDLFA